MINVLFFARLKDEVGQPNIQMDDAHAGKTVLELQQKLIADGYSALSDSSIRIAVNQSFCDTDTIIQAGDEVAFMPPVTGG